MKHSITFVGANENKSFDALFDPSEKFSCIHPNTVAEILEDYSLKVVEKFSTDMMGISKEGKNSVRLRFYVDGILHSGGFLIIPELKEAVVIGSDLIRYCGLVINHQNNTIEVYAKLPSLRLI